MSTKRVPHIFVATMKAIGWNMLSPAKITINLTNKEALVLFEFLRRFDDESSYVFADQAEERVLWTLEGIREKQLVEIFSPDYKTLLQAAREELRDPE